MAIAAIWSGSAAALEAFEARIPELRSALRADDLVVIVADHGCDPAWRGTDHTREQVPILAFGPSVSPGSIGQRQTFADVAATVAAHLQLPHHVGRTIVLGGSASRRFNSRSEDHPTTRARAVSATPTSSDGASATARPRRSMESTPRGALQIDTL